MEVCTLEDKASHLKYTEIVLTTYCTLKCIDCSNYINMYKEPYHVSYDMVIQSFDKLLELVESIDSVGLLGGEPFLYPYLGEVVDYLCNQDKVKGIRVVTNGTIICKDDILLEKLTNSKVLIQINEYKCSQKAKEVCSVFKSKNIRVFYVDRSKELWRKYNSSIKRVKDEKSYRNQFIKCNMMCRSILNGKLFYCPRSAHGDDIGLFKEGKYINLLENVPLEELRKKTYSFLYNSDYLEACKYCNAGTDDFKEIEAAIQ